MLEIKDIDLDVDYDSLCLLESHLMNEVKRLGAEGFVKLYSSSMEDFRRDWSLRNFCFLLALLEYLDSSFSYDDVFKLPKFIADARDFLALELDDDLSDINNRYNEVKKIITNFLIGYNLSIKERKKI